MTTTQTDNELMSTKQAATYIGCSLRTLWNYVARGDAIPDRIKPGPNRDHLWSPATLDEIKAAKGWDR